MSLLTLTESLGSLSSTLHITQILSYIVVCKKIKHNILAIYPSTHEPAVPPPRLPHDSALLLASCCTMSEEEVHASWSSLKDIIWHEDEVFGRVADDGLLNKTFRENGGKLFPSTVSLWPPTLKCFNPECPYVKDNKPLKLQGVEERCAVLYTQDKGPVGVLAHHITYHGCKIIYHPTFYVAVDACTGKQYHYYYLGDEVPEVIQINEHRFVETRLMREWRNDMVISNKSATSCATVYHMNTPMPLPDGWPIQGLLRSEYIYDGFKVLSLLEYHIAHSSQLVVSHDGAQINRFDEAMENVNNEISRCGQPEIDHRCQKCVQRRSLPSSVTGLQSGALHAEFRIVRESFFEPWTVSALNTYQWRISAGSLSARLQLCKGSEHAQI
ncbi:hypothetical protein PM082_024038 [Marasmius tenuissimus]|nr:hypothetical protein PM082_024038 [Marasmius tenuissimus]